LYSKKDKPVKDKTLEKWVTSKAHLFINADNNTVHIYGPEVKSLTKAEKFEEAYAYAFNIAKIPKVGGLYALVAGILKTVFYYKPYNDFYEFANGFALFNETIKKLPELTGLSESECVSVKADYIGVNSRYLCWIATKLLREYNQVDRKESWFKETYSRLFHFMEMAFRMMPITNYKGNEEFKAAYIELYQSFSPVLIRLKGFTKSDPISLNKFDRIGSLLDTIAKELEI